MPRRHEVDAGQFRAINQLGHRALRGELGLTVALDLASGYEVAAPVVHDTQAMGEDGVQRVGLLDPGSPVGQIVARPRDDLHHLVERPVDEPGKVRRWDREDGRFPPLRGTAHSRSLPRPYGWGAWGGGDLPLPPPG
jgi:hypothetical protein